MAICYNLFANYMQVGGFMKEILLDTIIDVLKLIPFLFIAFLIIEIIEHKISDKSKKMISKSGKFGPIIGSLLGAIPQCGFSVVATNLYITRIVSLGTLISIYLSTSDEMLPILISNNMPLMDILKIIGIKVILGMFYGFIIDLIYRKSEKKNFHICEDDDCDCEESLIKSSIIHTLKTVLFIFIVSLILNICFEYIGKENIEKVFMSSSIFAPLISCLIGLIPNCASSVIITEIYLNNVITLGTAIGGLLTNSGLSLLVLFKNNKNIKENLIIVAIIYFIGVISGIIINLIA